jgi:hypothetical protein
MAPGHPREEPAARAIPLPVPDARRDLGVCDRATDAVLVIQLRVSDLAVCVDPATLSNTCLERTR